MLASPAPIAPIILIGLAGLLGSLALLFGIQWVCAAFYTSFLRWRYPTLLQRRTYLLRGVTPYNPNLTDTQRLEKIRITGKSFAFMAAGLPALFPGELVSRYLGHHSLSDWPGHAQIIWLGCACSLFFVVLLGPWVMARGRLAHEALQAPIAPSPDPTPTFWPSLQTFRPD